MFDEVWKVACHEAGHAVAVWGQGGRVTRLTAGPFSVGGRCEFADGPVSRGYERAVVSYAGAEASWLLAGYSSDNGDDEMIALRAEPRRQQLDSARRWAKQLVHTYRAAALAVAKLLAARGSLTGAEAEAAMAAATHPRLLPAAATRGR